MLLFDYRDNDGVCRVNCIPTKPIDILDTVTTYPEQVGFIIPKTTRDVNIPRLAERYACFMAACDLIPADIHYIVSIPSPNFKPTYAKLLLELGCTILFDEARVGGVNDLFTISQNHNTDEEDTTRNTTLYNDRDFGAIVYTGDNSFYRKYADNKTNNQLENTCDNMLREISFNSRYSRMSVAPEDIVIDELATALSCGYHTFTLNADTKAQLDNTQELENWRARLFNIAGISTYPNDKTQQELKLLEDYIKIWKHFANQSGVHFDFYGTPTKIISPYIEAIGEVIGVKEAITAYMEYQIPVSDLIHDELQTYE
jgi:hypothetical protein